jgi:uncharacterized protein (TIGR02594 family)
MNVTALAVARTFSDVREIPGEQHHPAIIWFHSLATMKATTDEVAWCSSMVVAICHLLDLPNSYSAAARSWLRVGYGIPLKMARPGFDVVIFKRGGGDQPGPEVISAPGHVAWYLSHDDSQVEVWGGNQSDAVTAARFPRERVLGIRRLYG